MAVLNATRGGTTFKPYTAPDDAPVYNYNLKANGINTYGIKDTGGQEWYLTDGGQWRNTTTKQAQANMPTYAAANPTVNTMGAPAAPTPVAPVQTQPSAPAPFKSTFDFMRTQDQGIFGAPTSQPITKVNDMMMPNWQDSQAYKYAMDRGNKELDKNLAARGLLGSNVEFEQRNDLVQKVGADETQRQIQMATQDASASNDRYAQEVQTRQQLQQLLGQFAQNDSSTYYGNYNQDANRELDKDNQRLVAVQSALDFIKSMNPSNNGYQAIGELAGLDKTIGSTLASATGGGGGGGGGGGRAPTSSAIATMPTNPSSFNGTNYWLNAGASILPGLLSAWNK